MTARKTAAPKAAEPEVDITLINPADVAPDPEIEDPDYDESLAEVDPEEREFEVEMEPDPGGPTEEQP